MKRILSLDGGGLRRHDWELPYSIDMADVGAIPVLVDVGRKAAAAMNWEEILYEVEQP